MKKVMFSIAACLLCLCAGAEEIKWHKVEACDMTNDNGYSLWEASIEKPLLKILKKYGIRRVW